MGLPGVELFDDTDFRLVRPVSIGAEATIYEVTLRGTPLIAKVRVPKPYRNAVIDRDVRERRTLNEVRTMSKAHDIGIVVPHIVHVDLPNSIIFMEYVRGTELREVLYKSPETHLKFAGDLGRYLGEMHEHGLYHGDPTPANLIVRDGELCIIDFGLSGYSDDVEEHAADVNLVERSVYSSYPVMARDFIELFWRGYREVRGSFSEAEVKKRVAEIRRRARYVMR
ncbi:MAG: Kae1-associated kinase Bud32 [Aigarchaeota archaeon]|nr:Kae1-associated kinase Bud32 [Aigarchaeota archaeon]MDW8092635.1 Kae1-associated kinase Bud32 [Nitrososphaerota archaeon]